MANEVARFPVLQFTQESSDSTENTVIREFPLTIIFNNQELVTLLCSPMDLKYLATGFLLSEGLLESKDETKKITVDERRGVVRVETIEDKEVDEELLFKRTITSGCGRGTSLDSAADTQALGKVDSKSEITVPEVYSLVKEFQHGSRLYSETHGVHSAALCDRKSISVFEEDIGRHNAIDKVFGKCFLEDIPTDGRIIVTSGRVSSEIILKVAKRDIPIIMSIAAPTDVAVELAGNLGITLVGSVKGSKMNVYTNDWRIVRSEEQ